ncbi:MAG TPA: DUF2190 family protein [Gemmata sp.]
MNSFVHKGQRVPYTNATGSTIASGTVVRIVTGTSGIIGIAVADIANGSAGELEVQGVHELDKTTGQAWTLGQVLYWNPSTSKLTSTSSTAYTRAGRCGEAAASAATVGKVSLNVF